MATDTFLEKYTGAPLGARGVANLARFHVLEPGTITDLDIYVASMFGSGWLFQWYINGVAQFVAGSRPSVSDGAEHAAKTGLSIAVNKGDIISCDFEVPGSSGFINAPIDFGVTLVQSSSEVAGPGSATSNGIVLFNGTGGKIIKDSGKVISTDGTLSSNSDVLIPTQKAVKTYVDAAVGGPAFSTVTKTTASLANNAVETGVVALGKAFRLTAINVDRNARIRLYKTAAARTADAARSFGDTSYAGTQHGIIVDLLLDGTTGLTWELTPEALGSNGDGPIVSNVYYSIQNLSGSTHTVAVDFVEIVTVA